MLRDDVERYTNLTGEDGWSVPIMKVGAYLNGYNKGLEVFDKIRTEIETKYGQCDICEYFENYDYEENDISEYRPIGNIADILQIIDKYRTESEETETWNGIHAQITAPKGTFERIFNDADDDNDI